MRTLHTSARPVSKQGTIVFDPRVPATPRVPLRCVRYYDAKIRFRSTKTLCRAGSALHTLARLGGYVLLVQLVMYSWYQVCIKDGRNLFSYGGGASWPMLDRYSPRYVSTSVLVVHVHLPVPINGRNTFRDFRVRVRESSIFRGKRAIFFILPQFSVNS